MQEIYRRYAWRENVHIEPNTDIRNISNHDLPFELGKFTDEEIEAERQRAQVWLDDPHNYFDVTSLTDFYTERVRILLS